MSEDQLYDAAEREMDLYRREITRLTADGDRLRLRVADVTAALAVTEAERNDLRQALDERNAQHKALLDEFGLIEGLEGDQHGVAVLEATELADAYRDAGYPVRDDLSHLTGQRQTAAPGTPTTEEP